MASSWKRSLRWAALGIAVAVGLTASVVLGVWPWTKEEPPRALSPAEFADLAGVSFTLPSQRTDEAPSLTWIPIPDFPGTNAIWGATGRDVSGHIWFGVSAIDWGPHGAPAPSAHLFELVPDSSRLIDRGDAVAQLKRLGIARDGERQAKIHSRIIQGEYGYLYFASMDEVSDESKRGDAFSPSDSHLWRIHPPATEWEHLLAADEGLIAVSGVGRYIYALGYPGHKLYQYDTQTSRVRSVRVGAVQSHISRNLLTDYRGHAYVPRLRFTTESPSVLAVTLVEFDTNLRAVGETRLTHYCEHKAWESHGIVGYQYLADESIVFATHLGFLYRVEPGSNGPARISELGWFHPGGSSNVESMFTDDGRRHVFGAAQFGGEKAGGKYDWVAFDLAKRTATARPLDLPIPIDGSIALEGRDRSAPLPHPSGVLTATQQLLYGSITKDDQGCAYLVGRFALPDRSWPALLRVSPSPRRVLSAPYVAVAKNAEVKLPVVEEPKSSVVHEAPAPAPAPAPAAAPAAEPQPEPEPKGEVTPPAPVPEKPEESPRPDSIHQRDQFRSELRRLVELPTAKAAREIEALCQRYGRDIPPGAREAVGQALLEGGVRFNIEYRVQLQRRYGIPETIILDDLRLLEASNRNARGSFRTRDAILVMSARRLLAIPARSARRPVSGAAASSRPYSGPKP